MPAVLDSDATTRVAAFRGFEIPSIDLVVVDGPSRGQRLHVDDVIARIGVAPGNHLRLADDTVSGFHCEVHLHEDAIIVRDCGSTNGTYVEGVRLQEGVIRPGTTIHVGQSALRVDPAGQPSFVATSGSTSFGELIGSSLAMRRVYAILERVAATSATVLIEGETGTGKDVAARSLHRASPRAAGPFIPLDCGAIPDNIIESELFGHVRGAFSGAVSDRAGVFEEACGGTLFLDEIGEMPLAVQPKLLRAIDTLSIRRVGSNTERRVDVRIIAATNRDLTRCVNEGTFREDLYYRLAVVNLGLPPLRSRRDDVRLLAAHFYATLTGSTAPMPAALARSVAARSWPGNVRELRNFLERSVSLGLEEGPPVAPSSAARIKASGVATEPMVPLHLPLKDARQAWTESFESAYVRGMLRKTNGNLTRAAELAGVNRRFLQRLIARLGIRASEEAAEGAALELSAEPPA
jgi:transcriptional regulator with GAF, ATPase, and Fis domain